jgi:hypothetical protein
MEQARRNKQVANGAMIADTCVQCEAGRRKTPETVQCPANAHVQSSHLEQTEAKCLVTDKAWCLYTAVQAVSCLNFSINSTSSLLPR